MNPHRISVKYYLQDPDTLDSEKLIPMFHGWILHAKVPGMLIDVADYRHMIDGPGVVLIGHETDYAMDMSEGRPGILCRRKRAIESDWDQMLRSLFRNALTACQTIAEEKIFAAPPRCATDEALLVFADRLNTSNTQQACDRLTEQVQPFIEKLYDSAAVNLHRDSLDERSCLGLRIKVSASPPPDALLGRL